MEVYIEDLKSKICIATGPRLSRTFGIPKITLLWVMVPKKYYITAFSYHAVLEQTSNPTDS